MADQLPVIYLTRHCKTAWNLEGRIQGSIDMPLCPEGLAEAAALLPRLEAYRFDRIVSSPYQRALQTARVFSEGLEIPLGTHPGLRELDHGDWEGQRFDRLLRNHASRYGDWLQDASRVSIPGSSETVFEAAARVLRALGDTAASYGGECVLVVLHKHIRALLNCRLNGCSLASFGQFIEEGIEPKPIGVQQLKRIVTEFGVIPKDHR